MRLTSFMRMQMVGLACLGIWSFAGGLEQLTLKGDFRGRYEYTDFDSVDRTRYRVRFRLKAGWRLNEMWSIGTRAVTGNPSDPHSSHQTLDDGFEKWDLSLDRAFVKYESEKVTAQFGKFGHPVRSLTVFGGLIWDNDIQSEGLSLSYRSMRSFYAIGNAYVFDEQSGDSDTFAYEAQFGGKYRDLDWALAYYRFDDLGGAVDFDANLIEAQVALAYEVGANKLRSTAQVFVNTDGVSDQDLGFSVGQEVAMTGWIKRCYIQYQDVEAQAIAPYLAQDDFLDSSDFQGLVLGVHWKLLKSASVHTWVLAQDTDASGEEIRFRVDFNFKF